MKTIAVTIDEETLVRIDALRASSNRFSSRSALVRASLGAYVASERRRAEEDRERRIIQEHKLTLNRQLEALVTEQAQA